MARWRKSGSQASLKRRPPHLRPKPRVLVVCEGDVTEPRYLEDLKDAEKNLLVHFDVRRGKGDDPLTLVERAIQARDRANQKAEEEGPHYRFEQVWCVFDVDEHPRLPQAKRLARREEIYLALSNPCFELWALLHFQHQGGFIRAKQVQRELKQHIPGYDKELPFDELYPAYPTAVERAKQIWKERRAAGSPGGNPSTRVYRLTELIRKYGKRHGKRGA